MSDSEKIMAHWKTVPRTIPDEAWRGVTRAVFREGHLYPDVFRVVDGVGVHDDSDDDEAIRWLSHFTMDNYDEWAGAVVLCPRGPRFEDVMVRFDEVHKFISLGYLNPYRYPGVPDWYFFWTGHHSMASMKKWCRSVGLLPQKDLAQGRGGFGADDGLRSHRPKD